MSKELFTIPPRRFRGETAVVASRLPVELISLLDDLSHRTGRSRNEIIQLCLEFAIDNMDDQDGDENTQRDYGQKELIGLRILIEQVKAKLLLLPGENNNEMVSLDALLDDLKFSVMGKSRKDTSEIDDQLLRLASRMAAEVDNLVDIHSSDTSGVSEIRAEMQLLIQERNLLKRT